MSVELTLPPTVDSLALEFCDEMRATLSPEQLEQVVSLNEAEMDSCVCHSHDVCDANMILHEIFLRRGIDLTEEGAMDRWAYLWNQTWDLAKSRSFRMFKKGDHVEILKEFQDKGDDAFTWIAMSDEEKGRVDIQPVDIPMYLKPLYTVQIGWIKLA